jgi:hypothetical protein
MPTSVCAPLRRKLIVLTITEFPSGRSSAIR